MMPMYCGGGGGGGGKYTTAMIALMMMMMIRKAAPFQQPAHIFISLCSSAAFHVGIVAAAGRSSSDFGIYSSDLWGLLPLEVQMVGRECRIGSLWPPPLNHPYIPN